MVLISLVLTIVIEGYFPKVRKGCTSGSYSSKGAHRKNCDTKLEGYRHEPSGFHFISACLYIENMGKICSKFVVLSRLLEWKFLKLESQSP